MSASLQNSNVKKWARRTKNTIIVRFEFSENVLNPTKANVCFIYDSAAESPIDKIFTPD